MQKFEDSHERCSNVEPHVSTNSRHQILKLLKVLNIYLFVSFNTMWNKIEQHIVYLQHGAQSVNFPHPSFLLHVHDKLSRSTFITLKGQCHDIVSPDPNGHAIK
jgi:hypothetical protein